MEFSLGFLVVLILIIFPGLIYRRLYFYGEFSKEFKSRYNLISLIALAIIPGIINLVCVYFFYDTFFNNIDLGEIIDKFKDLNSENFRFKKSEETPIKELVNTKAVPFIGFLYLTSFLIGSVSGRLVRISKIDTKFKLLRFKNYWFYLFNGQHTSFKKMKHLKKRNKKHVFTKVDILVDSNSKTHLYSGIIVDYELHENECDTLSKIMLQNAERYGIRDNKRVPIEVPGNLLVVDCSSMKNINFTYIYEETKSILESRFPNYVETIFGLITLLIIPVFIFKADSLNIEIYNTYFELHWFKKIIVFLISIQILSLLNPVLKDNGEYKFVNLKNILAKVIWIIGLSILLWIIY